MKNTTILKYSHFKADIHGHGGNHRTSQIHELLNSAKIKIQDCPDTSILKSKWNRYSNGLKFLTKTKFKIYPDYRLVGLCGHYYQNLKEAMEKYNHNKLLLWEHTQNYLAPYIAQEQQFKIVAVPHNLESLVPNSLDVFTKESLPNSLRNEIKFIAQSDAIFCISREEQWLLKLFGVDADFLPYYPPQSLLSNLLEIRKLRNSHTSKHRLLILGTCFNPPTKIGIIEQIQWLSRIKSRLNFEVDIAGYGTETLAEHCQQYNFNLIGSVEPEKLNYLLSNAKAILVHQQAGAGVLTRIPEMLIAGIPVIANANACRSAFGYSGVYCYDSKEELESLIEQDLDIPPVIPRPEAAEKRFIQRITELANCEKKETVILKKYE